MQSFFFRELQLITVLLLIRDSYMSWSTSFDSFKSLCWSFHFWFPFVFINFFCPTKNMDLFDFKKTLWFF